MSSIFLNLLCFDVPFVGNVAQSEEGPSLWVWILLIAAGIVATITDLRTMLIPNWLTLPLLVAGLTYSGIVAGMPGVVDSLKGAGMAGGVFLAAYAFARGGAGDAKLMMAFGSWLGFQSATVLLLSVAIVGFFAAMGLIVKRCGITQIPNAIFHQIMMTRLGFLRFLKGHKLNQDENVIYQAKPQPRPKLWFPYAPSILLGTIAAWWYWEQFGGVL